MLVVLRDQKILIGYLRSVDQFGKCTSTLIFVYTTMSNKRHFSFLLSLFIIGNLLLQGTVERIHVGVEYGDIPRGIYLVRGENVALCGEIVNEP